ncbi:hypothetical protein EYF80_022798 [Liparis tanakae]|uniref:Uncharacterized protein n=1 Tax=Liparis tanakae TaxID=230148 RepID=A0A4Z2HP33_9TELE|nr:hypothetical protein EYF80_022798 [Liparis tanakae]
MWRRPPGNDQTCRKLADLAGFTAGYDAGSGKQTQRGTFYEEANGRECVKLLGAGGLGDGETAVKDRPVQVTLRQERSDADVEVADIVGVACGSRHSFVWTDAGQGYSFGNNFYAQLATGICMAAPSPHLFLLGKGYGCSSRGL